MMPAESSAQTPQQQVAADGSATQPAFDDIANGGMPAGADAAAESLPSLGVLSTQEHCRPPAARSFAADPGGSSAGSPADHTGQSAPMAPAVAHRTPVPEPFPGAAVINGSSAPATVVCQLPPSEASAVPALASEPVLAEGVAKSGSSQEHVYAGGPVTPGTVAALADLLSVVSIRSAVATPPSATRKQDRTVGLVYDQAMELHHGPPSAALQGPLLMPCTCGWPLRQAYPHMETGTATNVQAAYLLRQPVDQATQTGRVITQARLVLLTSHADHPECPERTAHLFRMLNEEGLAQRCWRLPARQVSIVYMRYLLTDLRAPRDLLCRLWLLTGCVTAGHMCCKGVGPGAATCSQRRAHRRGRQRVRCGGRGRAANRHICQRWHPGRGSAVSWLRCGGALSSNTSIHYAHC